MFLRFALAGAGDVMPLRSILATLGFSLGSAAGGRVSVYFGAHRGHLMALVLGAESGLMAIALGVSLAPLRWSLVS